MSKILAVDCDNVLAQSDVTWRNWLDKRYVRKEEHKDYDREPVVNYDLSQYYVGLTTDTALDYYRDRDCYVGIPTVPGSLDALEYMKLKGYEIVVVTHVKGDHLKGKFHWLHEHYPGLIDGYIATKEKYYVGADIFIDDRINHCNLYKERHPNARVYWLDTPYSQRDGVKDDVIFVENWNDFLKKEGELDV